MKQKLIRITTVPISLEKLLTGQLRFMNSFYDVIAVSSEKENLEKFGKAEGLPVFPIEMTRKITPVQDFMAIVKLFFFLRKQKPFIVHTHTPKAGLVGMIAAKMAGVPHRLHTVAGLPLLETVGAKRKILDFVEKIIYGAATAVYPNSHGLRTIIEENNYCSTKKLKVLANGSSNGIDTSHFDPALFTSAQNQKLKEQWHIAKDDFVFIFVGRLVKDKGINELVEAFGVLNSENQHVKLLLVGNFENDLDPLDESTMKRISEGKGIIEAGYQNDVRPYLAIADALVFPSYREGFPNVVMQAGAFGLPSVVSDINGCNEIIIDGKNGTIIPVKNSGAIYEAMKKMSSATPWMDSLKQNARPMIVSRFEQKVVWEAIRNEYRQLENK
ncbi:glycosyltransferase family 4 protein [Flavobacterium humi]|uniref:Glycosyltransferase family 1 protein n=1 Tax=Flavobacterium humi TaxID=2562683 RepID=A0A4Z0L467_9FLAO|nr:glycosyltransferase family 4 protein [Flavobacterium humi]TGD57143.1 glycosyltransferase family 1 protein [Flavobacterium humi]